MSLISAPFGTFLDTISSANVLPMRFPAIAATPSGLSSRAATSSATPWSQFSETIERRLRFSY
jgi:hypothetical protein